VSDVEQASFSVERNSGGDLRILWTGAEDYAGLLKTNFPTVRFKTVFKARYGAYNFGMYAHISAEDEEHIRRFCRVLSGAVWLNDQLDASFALAIHSSYPHGQFQRTPTDELVYGAKPYHRSATADNKAKAVQIASLMASFIQDCPVYASANAVAAVPPSDPDKPFDLPTYVAAEVARLTKKLDVSRGVRKTRRTQPMQDCRTAAEKAANIRGAFQAVTGILRDKTVVLVDDMYDSGQSINEAGRAIRSAQASAVLGLTATKTQPRP
jgi:predicted amidophosphoribosyltransferase